MSHCEYAHQRALPRQRIAYNVASILGAALTTAAVWLNTSYGVGAVGGYLAFASDPGHLSSSALTRPVTLDISTTK